MMKRRITELGYWGLAFLAILASMGVGYFVVTAQKNP